MTIQRLSRTAAVAAAGTALVFTLSACSGGATASSDGGGTDAASATSAADLGGLDALVEAAKAEGELNVIALPDTWANYGELISGFEDEYGITVNSADPDVSSAEEISTAENLAGQDTAPDVFDLGPAVALANTDVFAPYKVQSWDDIPEGNKEESGLWVNDYTGLMSIGFDAAAVPAPASLEDLLGADYRGSVAINGDPTQAGAAAAAVQLAALQSGGSADDVQAGIDFFEKLNDAGNSCRWTRPTPPSPRARPLSSSTGATTTSPPGRRTRAPASGRRPSSRAPPSAATTTRRSTPTLRTRRPRGSGRSTSTPTPRRTSTSPPAPTRCAWPR